MEQAATRQHAHANTVYHCLFAYYKLGYSRQHLAHIFNKSEHTIRNWIKIYETTGSLTMAQKKQYTKAQRQWSFDFYQEHPLTYLDEAQDAFKQAFLIDISMTSVWRIIHEFGLTWKVLERRAMHIKKRDVFRFVEELSHIDWCHHNVVFLDEVSFDNRGMIRKRGYALRGEMVAIRGEFARKPQVSLLAFIGVNSILDYFSTEDTFDRLEFTRCCQDFIHCPNGPVRQYPGRNSVWILDGASIHRHPEVIRYLRSAGIVPVFLPAYCPFFNPIEFLFGYVKRSFQRHYNESSGRNLMPFIAQTFRRFQKYNMGKVFQHCGWKIQGYFDPVGPLSRERHTQTELNTGEIIQDDLEFTELEPDS